MSWQTPSRSHVEVLFALPEEQTPFWRVNPDKRRFHSCYSGAGAQNSQRVATQLLDVQERSWNSECRAFLICGFAGGLVSGLTPGTLIIGSSVMNSTGEVLPADSRLLATAESVRLPRIAAMWGAIFTADKVLGQSTEKQELAKQYDAVAVDMETFAAAHVADSHHVPWLAIRVVTDGVNDDMPLDFNALTRPDGSVDKKRIVLTTLTHPWKIPALIGLGMRSSVAAKNLAAFLKVYLKALPDVNP